MNLRSAYHLSCLLLSLPVTGICQQGDVLRPLVYEAVSPKHAPVIDGKAGAKEWKDAAWSSAFTDISSASGPAPLYETRIKMLHDDSILYILAWMKEPHVTAAMTKHDDLLFKENDFEVFIDADGDGKNYVEIEINAAGTVMDLKLDKPYSEGGKADMEWDTPGLLTAVQVDGTLNDDRDTDKGWYAELSVPLSRLLDAGQQMKDHSWRINFLRVEKTSTKNNTELIPHEYYWAWTPQGAVNMHLPSKWGYLHLTN